MMAFGGSIDQGQAEQYGIHSTIDFFYLHGDVFTVYDINGKDDIKITCCLPGSLNISIGMYLKLYCPLISTYVAFRTINS